MKIHIIKFNKKIMSIILLAIFLAVCIFFIIISLKAVHTVSTQDLRENDMTIIIDAGHGGEDGGAVASNGTMEKEINLKIALSLNDLLKAAGYKTLMIRDSDKDLGNSVLSTVKERKVSDLHNRAEIVNKTENAILVSIHQNYFEQSKYYGAQIFCSPNTDDSLILGENIRTQIIKNTQPDNNRELKVADSNIYLLKAVNCPAVIVECGFLSNADEAAKLCTEEYRIQIASSIYNGICDYMREI